MSRLFVFGDSFSHPSDEKDFATYYHSVAKKLDAKCYNFSKNGTGPEYSMIEFNKAMFEYSFRDNDYIIMLLSDPSRDHDGNHSFENIRNLTYLNYISKHFYQDVKLFCNIIWNDTAFCDGRVFANGDSRRFIENNEKFPNTKFKSKKFLILNNVENFYYCDCELGIIHMQEFKEIYDIHTNETEEVLHLTNNTNKKFQVDTINDDRINHMSQRTHDTFAKLIIDFFLHNKKPVNTDNMFEKGFLEADDPYVKIRKEFIYE